MVTLPYSQISNERGVSLVELVTAIFIITLLLSSIYIMLRPNELRESARDALEMITNDSE